MGKRAHVEAARAAEHPFQRETTVDNDLQEAIDYTLSMGRSLNEWRDAAIQKLRSVAEGFREAHAQLVRRVHPSIQRIVACINVPLFRHLLEEYEYDDPEADYPAPEAGVDWHAHQDRVTFRFSMQSPTKTV